MLPLAKNALHGSYLCDLGGYWFRQGGVIDRWMIKDFVAMRWGVSDILRETTGSVPANNADWDEDGNWPVGRPFNHRLLQRIIDQKAHGVGEGIFIKVDASSTTEELSGSPACS